MFPQHTTCKRHIYKVDNKIIFYLEIDIKNIFKAKYIIHLQFVITMKIDWLFGIITMKVFALN